MAKKKYKKTPLWLIFKPKLVGKGGEREKTKNCLSVPFLPDGKYKIPKKVKKNKKIKKYRCGFISCRNRLENSEKEKK